jgi:hypothetical protein
MEQEREWLEQREYDIGKQVRTGTFFFVCWHNLTFDPNSPIHGTQTTTKPRVLVQNLMMALKWRRHPFPNCCWLLRSFANSRQIRIVHYSFAFFSLESEKNGEAGGDGFGR